MTNQSSPPVTMHVTDHYHFLIQELEETRNTLVRAFNRGGSKKRPGTSLDHAQMIVMQNVFKRRIDYVRSLIEADRVMVEIQK